MPKKTRKMKQRAAMRRVVQAPTAAEGPEGTRSIVEESPVRMRPTFTSSPARPNTPLTFDYSHIYGDLKRIAMFAGFFFMVLVVLSFVIK